MKFAYADPPYLGQSAKHYSDHEDYAGEVDHAELIPRLVADYPDGWALSASSPSLRELLAMCPKDVRVMAWTKPFASWKKGVYPAYAWEPVILHGGRNAYGDRQTVPDFVAEPITLKRGLSGAKPERVCRWLFDCLGAEPGDEMHDLYPGSGAVANAWKRFCAQPRLPFPSEPETEPLEAA